MTNFLGWVWPGEPLFQSLKKTLLISLFFLFKDNHPAKVECKTATFRWVWPGMRLVQSDCRILWSTITLEGINSWYRRFLYEDIHQGKVTCETTTFWLVRPRCASGVVKIQWFLDHHYLWKESVDIFDWPLLFIFLFYFCFLAFLIKLVGDPFSYGLFLNNPFICLFIL